MTLDDLTPRPYSEGTDGFFAMPDPEYRKAPEVSQSMLKVLRRSPGHLYAEMLGLVKKEPTEAQVLGTLADHALLEPESYQGSYYVRPEGLKFTTTEGKAWKAEHNDRPIITVDEERDIKGMMESVLNNRIARAMVLGGFSQVSAFCHHGPTGLLRKGRYDKLLVDSQHRPVIPDLKTIDNGSPRLFANAVARWWYHCQAAYYVDIFEDITGEDAFFPFIVVEKNPPYACTVYQLDAETLNAGRNQYQADLEVFARCRDTGNWPTYSEQIETIRLPRWALDPQSPIVPD